MKFTVSKSTLMEKLTLAMGTVSNKNTITAIEGILIETLESGRIRITSYDMNKGFRAEMDPVSIEREGRFIINAARLFQTVRVMPNDDITFDIKDNGNCEISSYKSSFSMFSMPGENFPNIPDLVTERGFTTLADNIKRMIGKVQHSISEQDNRPMLRGAFFKVGENGLEVVSCDSFTLSKCTLSCEVGSLSASGENNYSFIIPGEALGELSKVLSDGDNTEVMFYLSRKHAIIAKDDNIFFTRIIDSEYIDYNRIIPKDNDIKVEVDKSRFLSGLERANIIAEEKIQGSGRSYVKLIVEDQYLTLNSTSVNGEVSDEMDCLHEGGDIEIGFNCRYLINSTKVIDSENIVITLKGATQAITIEPKESEEGFTSFYMILPVRMNDAK